MPQKNPNALQIHHTELDFYDADRPGDFCVIKEVEIKGRRFRLIEMFPEKCNSNQPLTKSNIIKLVR
jgi:hypothetical protein